MFRKCGGFIFCEIPEPEIPSRWNILTALAFPEGTAADEKKKKRKEDKAYFEQAF